MTRRRNTIVKKPRRNKSAEIVLKSFQYGWGDIKTNTETTIPGLMILANPAGFRWLAQYFEWMSNLEWRTTRLSHADSDDHQHFRDSSPPVNKHLSENVEIRLGCLTKENRRAVFKKYDIKRQTRTSRDR